MHYAVVVVDAPHSPEGRSTGSWPSFSIAVAPTNERVPPSCKPSPNVWLLPLPSETPALASIVTAAQDLHIPHRVLYFDGLPSEYSYAPQKP